MIGPNSITVSEFEPLSWQVAPFQDTSAVLLLTGSAGGGKSTIAAEKLHAYCLRYPGVACAGIRKAREFASKSVVFALKDAMNGQDVNYNKSEMIFEYPNSSRIFIAGMADEKQRQALRSINGDGSLAMVWVEEANALTRDDMNEIRARMRDTHAPWRQIILTTNPDAPTHWINVDLIQGGGASVYMSSASDNVHNPSEYLNTLNSLTGVQKLRLADGLWAQADGIVYEGFRDDLHVVDPFDIPKDWRRFRVIDFGYTNPFVCQFWAMDGDSRMYMYKEMYMSGRTVNRHVPDIQEISGDDHFEAAIADHDAEDRATLHEHGINTEPAKKDVSAGIQRVEDRLKVAGDGRPRMFFFRNALYEMDDTLVDKRKPTSTVAEFASYVWPKSVDGRPVKEVPVKDNDHGMDALRYAVMYADNPIFYA